MIIRVKTEHNDLSLSDKTLKKTELIGNVYIIEALGITKEEVQKQIDDTIDDTAELKANKRSDIYDVDDKEKTYPNTQAVINYTGSVAGSAAQQAINEAKAETTKQVSAHNTATNNHQDIRAEINDITTANNIIDVVSTKATLNGYDNSRVKLNDIIVVAADESKGGAKSFYKYLGASPQTRAWVYQFSEQIKADLVNGKVPTAQLPALAVTDTFTVNNEQSMLYLEAQKGDVCIRLDQSKTYILAAEPASLIANWKEMLSPTSAVTSINGHTGALTIDKAFVGLGAVDNTRDNEKSVSYATSAGSAPANGGNANTLAISRSDVPNWWWFLRAEFTPNTFEANIIATDGLGETVRTKVDTATTAQYNTFTAITDVKTWLDDKLPGVYFASAQSVLNGPTVSNSWYFYVGYKWSNGNNYQWIEAKTIYNTEKPLQKYYIKKDSNIWSAWIEECNSNNSGWV